MSNYPFATPQTGAHANAPNATATNTNTHTPILPPTLGTVQLLDRERERTPLTMAGTAPHGQTQTQTQTHSHAVTVSAPTATAATVSGQSLSAVQANAPPSMSRPGSSAAGGVGGVGVVSGTSTQSMESALYGLFPSSSLCFVLEAMVKRLERFSQLDSYSSIRVSTAQELNDELLLDERMRRPDVQSAMPRTIPTPKSIQKLEKLRRHYEICPSLLSFIQTQAANMTQFSAYPYSFSQHFAPLPTFQQRRYQFTAANLLSMTLQNKLGSECQEMIRSAMQHPKCSLNIQQLSSFRPYVQHHQVYSVSAQSAAAVAASSTTSSMLLDPAISELHVWREVHIEKENDVFGIPTPSVTNSAASISTSASALEIYHCLWYGRPPPTHARYSSSLRPMKAFSVNDVHAFLVAFPTLQFQYEWLEEGLLFEESDGLEVRIFVIYRLQRPAELKSAEKMKSLEGKYFLSVKCIQESEKFPEADQNVNEYAKELQQWVQFTKYTPTFT